MFTICKQIIEQGRLETELSQAAKAEKQFTREIGAIERRFYQCVQQPHLTWANTEWTSEKAHNIAAAGIMKVRTDDRVSSAYFRPGLYFEIFAKEIEDATVRRSLEQEPMLILICHGLVADKHYEGWRQRFVERAKHLSSPEGLLCCRTFYNYYCAREFVGFLEWCDDSAYEDCRKNGERTIEERLFVGENESELAAYIQCECRPLKITPEA